MKLTKQDWKNGFDTWINSLNSESTKNSYLDAWNSLLKFSKKDISEIRKNDILGWINDMKLTNKTNKTIRTRISAVSAFYSSLKVIFTEITEDGFEVPILDVNPTRGIKKPPDETKEEIYYLKSEEINRLLGVIDQTTVQGSRDFALFLCYILLGRRCSEIRLLKWADFDTRSEIIQYYWKGKGKSGKAVCPRFVFDAICKHLEIAGRLSKIKGDDYIFISFSDSAKNLPTVSKNWKPGDALSRRVIGKLLKKYGELAGLDVYRLHTHCLRHSAACLLYEAGAKMLDIQNFLGHASLNTTSKYLHRIRGNENQFAEEMINLLDLPEI